MLKFYEAKEEALNGILKPLRLESGSLKIRSPTEVKVLNILPRFLGPRISYPTPALDTEAN